MKKKAILIPLIGGLAFCILSGYSSGPGYYGINRTGSQGSVTNCSGNVSGTGCHGTATGTTVLLTVDSGTTTTATTHYVPGLTYTIKIHGNNSNSLPDFGWELSTVSGSGTAQVQAGTFVTPIPAHTYIDSVSGTGLHVFEQGTPWLGSPAGTYDVSVQWTAPSSNVGNITLYCTLNAVVGTSGSVSPMDAAGNTSLVLTPIITNAVSAVAANLGVTTFPDPVASDLNLNMTNTMAGDYNIYVFGMNGSMLYNQAVSIKGAGRSVCINARAWSAGLYNVVIEGRNGRQSMLVVKQ